MLPTVGTGGFSCPSIAHRSSARPTPTARTSRRCTRRDSASSDVRSWRLTAVLNALSRPVVTARTRALSPPRLIRVGSGARDKCDRRCRRGDEHVAPEPVPSVYGAGRHPRLLRATRRVLVPSRVEPMIEPRHDGLLVAAAARCAGRLLSCKRWSPKRAVGRLPAARHSGIFRAQASCPDVLRDDCAKWVGERGSSIHHSLSRPAATVDAECVARSAAQKPR